MGTKVQYKSSLPGYYPMRDLNNDSNNRSWHLFYGERALTNAQCHNVFLQRAGANGYLGDDKDVVKQQMLEHEAIFKNQVFELHRLYKIQRDLMDKFKSTELCRNPLTVDSLFTSSPLASQVTSEDASRWNLPSFPMANSSSARHSTSGFEEGHSSLSSVKGNNQKPCFFPPQIGSITKDSQVFDSRPTKLRGKILDLQLPANEYIDPEGGEQFHDENVPGTLNHNHIKNQKLELESDVKLYADDGERTGCLQDASKPDACSGNRSCLADLNEPIQLVETNTSTYVDPLGPASCHGQAQCPNPSSGSESGLINLQRKNSLNIDNGSDNVTGNSLYLDNNIRRGGTLPHFLELEPSHSYKKFSSQGFQAKMWPVSSQPMQNFLNEIHEPPPFYPAGKGKVEQSREGPVCGLQFTKRSHEINGKQPCSVVPSHISIPHPTAPDFGKSWSNSNSSWGIANTNFQKLTSVQTRQCLNSAASSHKNFHSPVHDIESFGEKWHHSNDSRPIKGFDSEITCHNGSFLGSSSESKDEVGYPSSISYNYWKGCNDNNQAPAGLTHCMSLKLLKDSMSMDTKYPKETNYNTVPSNSLSNEAVQKIGENCALLPWLRGTPAGNDETTNSGRFSSAAELSYVRFSINCLPDKNGNDNGPSHIIYNKESDECLSSGKLLGLPIPEAIHDPKNETSSLDLPSAHLLSLSEVEDNRKDRVVDINLPCDPLVAESDKQVAANNLDTKERAETKVPCSRLIDLNLCLSDDEASLRSTPKTTIKTWAEIDLEAPAISETEDIIPDAEIIEIKHELASKTQCKALSQHDEFMALAAEAIVAISSSVSHGYLEDAACNAAQGSIDNPLNWLVEMVLSCGNDFGSEYQAALRTKPSGDKVESSSEGMDSFESMTLGLTETKEEEYVPKPFVPGHITVEEKATPLLQNRPRKGPGRRGRQRRDFQRDILPGLASLSRHEVTEDLNTFGGLMRATGHLWNPGLTKRNSSRNASGRGRRRSVITPTPHPTVNLPLMHQLNNGEDSSLTGWGKTTRRLRRQRVPASNLAAIPLV